MLPFCHAHIATETIRYQDLDGIEQQGSFEFTSKIKFTSKVRLATSQSKLSLIKQHRNKRNFPFTEKRMRNEHIIQNAGQNKKKATEVTLNCASTKTNSFCLQGIEEYLFEIMHQRNNSNNMHYKYYLAPAKAMKNSFASPPGFQNN